MPRPFATQPISTGKKDYPWMYPVPVEVRHLHGGSARKYFRKRGECLLFISALRRQRGEYTAAFNEMPDAQKAQCHEALAILAPHPGARSLPELAREEAARLDVASRSLPLETIIAEMLAAKKADGARPNYLRGLRGGVNTFARKFSGRLASSIAGNEIAAWLRETYPNPNSRDSYRRNVSVLFSFALEKKYVAANPVGETKPVNARRDHEVEILTPGELAALFAHAPASLRPYLALSAFAGLRSAEALQITWENVRGDAIYVPKKASKTVARRVPIVPALAEWLETFDRSERLCMPYGSWRKLMRPATIAAGWPAGDWPQNALRHSAISYWLAVEPNRAAVAKWSGNSEAVQERHYENPRSPEEAAAWYAVLPAILPN